MPEPDLLVLSVAAAVADAQPIDWGSTDAADLTPEEHGLIAELRLLESIHTLHRRGDLSPSSDTPAAETRTTRTGARLDVWRHLELREVLGIGAFGTVYRAWDSQLASEVALKVLAGDARVEASVIEEASLLARVRHPNVVSIYGADRWNGKVGLWMELVRGRTLKDLVREHGTFGAREAALVGLDLTRALAAVHGAGLVHRDIKAQNVMREEGGRIVLMDFGAGVESAGRGAQARLVGTPLYVAPEQFDGLQSTAKSDIYSLGVLLYHIVTGSFPITADSLPAAEAAHRRGERVRLRDVRPDLSMEFVRIVERAMHPDVHQRHGSAGELEADLAQFVVHEERRSETAGKTGTVTRPRSWWPLLVAATALVLAGAAAWLWYRRPPDRSPVSAAGLKSLAVLPFENLTGDPQQDYFVDGMTDLLTDQLATIPSLNVISRTSAMSFKGARKPLVQIGRDLHVDGLVEGSVSRSDERIRVTVRIIHAGADVRLWGNTYEREIEDAFRLQAEIAQQIASELHAVFGEKHRKSANQVVDTSPRAQEAYLRGRSLMHTYNRERLKEARTLLEEAVEIAPTFSLAWASLARCYTMLENTGVLPSSEAAALATHAANTALVHDPASFQAHATLADVLFKFAWNWTDADAHYREAIEANANASFARGQYAQFLSAAGRLDEAEQHARRGELTDPLSSEMKVTVGTVLYYKRRYQQALEKASEALTVDQGLATAHVLRARALSALGSYEAAIDEIQTSFTVTQDPAALAELGRILAEAGRVRDAEAVLLRLRAVTSGGLVAPLGEAYIEAALGRRAEGLKDLANAVDQRSSRVLWMRVDPRVDTLRSTSEFNRLLSRIGGTTNAGR